MNDICNECGSPMLSGYGKKINLCVAGYSEPEPPEYEEVLECPKCEAYKSYQKDLFDVMIPEKKYASEEIIDLIIEKYPNKGIYVSLVIKSILNACKTGKLVKREHPFLKHTYLYSSRGKCEFTDTALRDRELAEIPF